MSINCPEKTLSLPESALHPQNRGLTCGKTVTQRCVTGGLP